MRSVDRVANILSHLGEHGACSIAQVAAETNLPRPTVLRILDALAQQGFVIRGDHSAYRLGPRLMFLAMKSSGIIDLKSAARLAMERLAEVTDETAALQVLVGSHRVCIGQVEPRQLVRRVLEMNRPMAAHCGASSKVLLAWLPESRVLELIGKGPFERFTDRTPADSDQFLCQLRAVSQAGYAISIGERVSDGVAVAAPILTSTGGVLGAIAVVAPPHRTPEEKLVGWGPLVMDAAREIAVAYGAVAPA